MISRVLKTLLFGALLASPLTAFAQEATLSGTVMDSTSSVLPGVTITAVHQATGNRFVAVTDGRGSFRLPVRIGEYVVTAELQGFTTVTRGGVQLLVGQNAVLNLQMAPSTLQETVTVTAEAPLLDMADSSLGGNIDPKQMSELPGAGTRLDVAGAARAGQSHDGNGRGAGPGPHRRSRPARVPAQSRRSAGHRPARARRPAAFQPRRDRRVPVHFQSL